MILTYHNVAKISTNNTTVDIFNFLKQMFSLLKYKVVHLEDYEPENPKHIVIRFDDGYKGVYKYALPVLKFFKYPFEVFIVEDFYIKGENGDKNFLNQKELAIIIKSGGRLQYHTKSHPHLDEISCIKELEDEIICPNYLKKLDKKGFKFLAYPFWKYNNKVLDIVIQHYAGGCSGNGFADNSRYAMDGIRMDNSTKIDIIK